MKNSFKNVFYWFMGLIFCDLGVSLCTKSDLGLSMIGASPYILHVYMRDRFAWFSQGTAEYVWEAIVLVVACIILRRFKLRYLLSFVTAVLAGFCIDGWLFVLGGNAPYETLAGRITAFVLGTVVCAFGIAFYFHTTMPMQVYELAVYEIADRYKLNRNKVKFVNDAVLLVVAIVLSFLLTHKFTGIGIGTIIITIVNAPLIAFFDKLIFRKKN